MTDRSTFEHLGFWLNEIDDHAEKDTVVMVIGSKFDLVENDPSERGVPKEEAEKFAREYGLLYNETSAKTGHNIKEAFESLIEGNDFWGGD